VTWPILCDWTDDRLIVALCKSAFVCSPAVSFGMLSTFCVHNVWYLDHFDLFTHTNHHTARSYQRKAPETSRTNQIGPNVPQTLI
jgi:hypothetical protein